MNRGRRISRRIFCGRDGPQGVRRSNRATSPAALAQRPRGAAKHRWTADVDIFDRFSQRHIRFGDRLFEWIEINDDEIDRFETLVARFLFMLRIASLVEQPTVNAGMQSFHSPFQHLGKSRKTGYVPDRDLFLTQQFRRSTGRNNVDTLLVERAREVGNAALVGNGKEGAGDFHGNAEAIKS